MKQTKLIMGMPVTVEIVDAFATKKVLGEIFDYFTYIDNKFSTYKENSEIIHINQGKLQKKDYSCDMKEVLKLCEQTKSETNGYFDIEMNGKRDPSGLVKGWAIYNAANLLAGMGFKNYYVEAGGDIQVSGKNRDGKKWRIGIRNPFNRNETVKTVSLTNNGIATSGTYIRGQHVYNPFNPKQKISDIVSLTVIGKNIYEADRFATAAFAMGKSGIEFMEKLSGFERYMIDSMETATFTSGFNKYTINE